MRIPLERLSGGAAAILVVALSAGCRDECGRVYHYQGADALPFSQRRVTAEKTLAAAMGSHETQLTWREYGLPDTSLSLSAEPPPVRTDDLSVLIEGASGAFVAHDSDSHHEEYSEQETGGCSTSDASKQVQVHLVSATRGYDFTFPGTLREEDGAPDPGDLVQYQASLYATATLPPEVLPEFRATFPPKAKLLLETGMFFPIDKAGRPLPLVATLTLRDADMADTAHYFTGNALDRGAAPADAAVVSDAAVGALDAGT